MLRWLSWNDYHWSPAVGPFYFEHIVKAPLESVPPTGNRSRGAFLRVNSVRAPHPLIVLDDRDIVKPEHAAELTRLIPDARLLILPGGHGDYIGEAVAIQGDSHYPELTAQLIGEFLDDRQ